LPADVEEERSNGWRRLVVAEGIEVHVRDDSPAARESTLLGIREAVRAALGRDADR
jgi:hypothetical protein